MHLKISWAGHAAMLAVYAFTNFSGANSVHAQTPTPIPSASANNSKPTTAPVERHEAPKGVYYLTEDTVVPLKNGLQGLPAGTEVKLVKDNGSTLQVTDGEHEFAVKKSQVTNDLDLAALIQKHAAGISALNEQNLQQREAILVKQQQDEVEFLRTHPLATPTPTPTPQTRR